MRSRELRLEGMTKTTLSVSGMTCSSCVAHVTDALSFQGIGAVDVNLASGSVAIEHASTIAPSRLIAALAAAGYDAAPSGRPKPAARTSSCCGG